MTDNTYRYFTPTGSDTFDAGWYLLDDDGMRQGNVPSAAFAGADTMIIDSNTPTSSPLTAGADNDVYLVTTDAPTGLVEISDDIGMNTIRFDNGVDIALFTFQNVGFAGNMSRQVVINMTTGTSIKITTPDNFVFEFADTGHALHGLSLTAQQMVDYVADKPIFEEASYMVDAAENIAADAAILTLSGRDKTTTTGDPDGVANGTTGTWRWFHKHNPDATIGTGDSYTFTEADRGAKIGVEYTYSDVVDAANSTTSKAIAILETELARVVVTPDAPAEDTDITLRDTDNDPQTPDVGSKVDAGDGSDTITGGDSNDEITGGKGDDKIDLGKSDTDTDVVIYGIGGQSAKDGGDNISNFNRVVDQFVFSLDSNQAGVSAITDYDSFLDYITKGTATLDDDEFRVQLDLGKDADGKTQIEGLFFHFASSTFYSGGRASLPLMKISFADPIDEDGIADIFTDENGQSVDASQVLNKYFFITDLDVLDDFMGGADSITYEIA